jgi:uncharacterized membrane protein YoaK (UPF0700 family)
MTISSDRLAVDPCEAHALPIRVRNGAAMFLAAASGATDAIGYLALGNVFTSSMTGNLALLGIALAHHDGERVGRIRSSFAPQSTFMTAGPMRIFRVAAGSNGCQQ